MTMTAKHFRNLVDAERLSQIRQWGDQKHDPDVWANIAGEEMGEICKAVNQGLPDHELLKEIVQLSAVLQAWVTSRDWEVE